MSHENSIKAALPRALKPGENYAPDRAVTAEEVRQGKPETFVDKTAKLLDDYRAALINAYALGQEIKLVYNIVPPKILHDAEFNNSTHRNPNGYPQIQIGLTIS
jgi:hypothetical protein